MAEEILDQKGDTDCSLKSRETQFDGQMLVFDRDFPLGYCVGRFAGQLQGWRGFPRSASRRLFTVVLNAAIEIHMCSIA